MRKIHGYLQDNCNSFGTEYTLVYNKYVVDFCETTPKNKQDLIEGVIHQMCGRFDPITDKKPEEVSQENN